MRVTSKIDSLLRQKIIDRPDVILDDPDVMKALIAANETAMGANIVDLRGVAMDRLESRLDRLENTHRGVIAAAYENMAGTNQIQRAVLRLLEAPDFAAFMKAITGDVPDILRVQSLRMVLETRQNDGPARNALEQYNDTIALVAPGFVNIYLSQGRNAPASYILLRQVHRGSEQVFGTAAKFIRSEAALPLDMGPGRLPGMLVLGAEDPYLFTAQQGTELLSFFGNVFERMMIRWLS